MLATGQRNHAGVEETRSRIVAAARELFERHGTRGTTTREVAERAGVNEATLFRHFGSKRALLDAMREQACGFEQLRAALSTLPGKDLARDLHTLALLTIEHMREKRAMMCVSLAEDAAGTDDAPEWRGPAQVLDDLAAYFAMRIGEGSLRGEPLLLARYFVGMLFSYVVGRKLWNSGVSDPKVIDDVIDLFLNGASA
jgi:AcrR family transcriptional regulator